MIIIIAHGLLACKAILEVDLLLELLSLLPWHELLGMLVRIRELTATFLVKVLLRASITVGRRLPERRMMIGHITSLVLLLKTLARSTHACIHQGRPLV